MHHKEGCQIITCQKHFDYLTTEKNSSIPLRHVYTAEKFDEAQPLE